jgi:hypothetical protein
MSAGAARDLGAYSMAAVVDLELHPATARSSHRLAALQGRAARARARR